MFKKLARKMMKKKMTPMDLFGEHVKNGKIKSKYFYRRIVKNFKKAIDEEDIEDF